MPILLVLSDSRTGLLSANPPGLFSVMPLGYEFYLCYKGKCAKLKPLKIELFGSAEMYLLPVTSQSLIFNIKLFGIFSPEIGLGKEERTVIARIPLDQGNGED